MTKAREMFDAWFNRQFLDPDGGDAHLPNWFKDDLRKAWDAALAAQADAAAIQPQRMRDREAREKEITRLATIEDCARLIESGAGMADLIDQDELDQQAKYIRALALTRPECGDAT